MSNPTANLPSSRRHSPVLTWFRQHLKKPVTAMLLVFFTIWTVQVDGASVVWDADGTSGGTTGGTGTWDTGTPLWDNLGTMVNWVNANNDTALFGGTAGTVTLGAPITAGGLTFTSNGYLLTGDTLTLAAPIGSNSPVIQVTGNGARATISSVLAGKRWFHQDGQRCSSVDEQYQLIQRRHCDQGWHGSH